MNEFKKYCRENLSASQSLFLTYHPDFSACESWRGLKVFVNQLDIPPDEAGLLEELHDEFHEVRRYGFTANS